MSSDGDIQIGLLGKPALFVGGQVQLFGGPRKAIALIAYLLLNRDRVLARAAVAERFWPDDDDENARAALRRHLHRALAALPPASPGCPWVLSDKTTLRWNPLAPLHLDTAAYEQLTKDGDLAAAVQLYRGDYVEDFYDEWIIVERERLRNLHATNLMALTNERARALDYRAAIDYVHALLRMDNLREDAIRRLMSLRFASGDRSGALADFESFSRRVREELGADPMPETIALREAIRRDDVTAVERGAAPAPRAPRGFPFVGRQDALRTARRAWEDAARGNGRTVFITGQTGIGKTRLIGELLANAEVQGGRIALGSTSLTEAEPYQPVAEALRAALPFLRFADIEPVKVAALSALLSEVRDFAPNLPPIPLVDSERERQRLFDAIGSAFARIAAKRPLLVVFEDVHWASAATIELLGFLMRRLRADPVFIVLSAREEALDANPALGAFLRRVDPRQSDHVALGPLELDDVCALAAAATNDSAEFARDLRDRTGGNAFFVTELLRERLNGGGSGAVPESIGQIVESRVGQLSEPARTLLETAAVLGTGFDSDVVRRVLGWTFAQTFDALDELIDCAIVHESTQRRGDFLFSHQLVHAALYEALASSTRKRLHRRMARTLQRLFADRPTMHAAVARHYDRADEREDASRQYLLAIEHAGAVFSHDEVVALATRALELATDARTRFDLYRLREEAASRSGDTDLQAADEVELRNTAIELGDDDLLGLALCRSIERTMNLSKRDEEREYIAALRGVSQRTSSSKWALEAALAAARHAINGGDAIVAEAILAGAEGLAQTVPDDRLAVDYWLVRSFNQGTESLGEAREYLENARRRVGGDRTLEIRCVRAEGNLADREGDAAELSRLSDVLLEHYIETGDIEGQAVAHQHLAMTKWYTLELDSQREHMRLALEAFGRSEKRSGTAAVLLNRGVARQHVGAFDEAQTDYEEARYLADAVGRKALGVLASANLASLALFREDFVRACMLAREAVPFDRLYEFRDAVHTALTTLGSAEFALGETAEGLRHLEEAAEICRQRDPRALLEILVELIPVHIALGQTSRAVECAEEVTQALAGDWRRVAFPAYALGTVATAFLADGQQQRGEAMAAQAQTLLRELAAKIPDDASRAGYLSLPFHRALLARSLLPAPSKGRS